MPVKRQRHYLGVNWFVANFNFKYIFAVGFFRGDVRKRDRPTQTRRSRAACDSADTSLILKQRMLAARDARLD